GLGCDRVVARQESSQLAPGGQVVAAVDEYSRTAVRVPCALNGVTAAFGLEDERISHVTDGRIVRHARGRLPVLVPDQHVSVTAGEQHDGSETLVGNGAVD